MGADTQGREAPPQPSPRGGRSTQPPKTQQEWAPAPWGGLGRGFWIVGEGLTTSSCFSTGASRTFFTANGGFFYRGHCRRHAWHDGGDGGDDTEEDLFSDGRHHRHHQGEADSSAHGFLCLFQPLPNPPQGEGVPHNRLKHSENGLPPLGEGRGGAFGGPGRGFRRAEGPLCRFRGTPTSSQRTSGRRGADSLCCCANTADCGHRDAG